MQISFISSSWFQVKLEIESLFDGEDFSESLTRAKFEELNMDLFRATLKPVSTDRYTDRQTDRMSKKTGNKNLWDSFLITRLPVKFRTFVITIFFLLLSGAKSVGRCGLEACGSGRSCSGRRIHSHPEGPTARQGVLWRQRTFKRHQSRWSCCLWGRGSGW